jgi:hypothetical protein
MGARNQEREKELGTIVSEAETQMVLKSEN